MNADQFRGRLEELKGLLEDWVGWMMGSQPLKERGQADLAMGLARAKFGDIREAVRKRSVSLGGRHRRPTL